MSKGYLLADVGGTNARFIFIPSQRSPNLRKVLFLKSRSFNNFSSLLKEALSYFKLDPKNTIACIALAGPVFNGRAKITNLGWEVDEKEVKKEIGFKKFIMVNDLYAVSAVLSKLKRNYIKKIKEGRRFKGSRVAIFCGTGLGVGVLVREKPLTILSTEAGHLSFQPINALDLEFLEFLKEKKKETSYEEVLSGRGLENIYEFLHKERLSASEITEQAKRSVERARQVLKLYFSYLGRFCGELLLCYLPWDGIYLGGGVITALSNFFFEDQYKRVFLESFLSSNKLIFLHEGVPVYQIVHPFPALLGCKAILESLGL